MATVASSTFLAIMIALHAGVAAELSLDDPLIRTRERLWPACHTLSRRGESRLKSGIVRVATSRPVSEGPPSPAGNGGASGVIPTGFRLTGADSGAGNAAGPIPEVDHEPPSA